MFKITISDNDNNNVSFEGSRLATAVTRALDSSMFDGLDPTFEANAISAIGRAAQAGMGNHIDMDPAESFSIMIEGPGVPRPLDLADVHNLPF